MFGSKSSLAHQAHIALSEPMTSKVQQSFSLDSSLAFPSPNPLINPTFRSVTLCQVLSETNNFLYEDIKNDFLQCLLKSTWKREKRVSQLVKRKDRQTDKTEGRNQ